MFKKTNILNKIVSLVISCNRSFNVTVAGGANEVGNALCLLLRTQPSINTLSIHDVGEEVRGLVADLEQIPSNSKIRCFSGPDVLDNALSGADLVIAVGKELPNPDTSETPKLLSNTEFIKSLASSISKMSAIPFVGIATEPLNILVPIATEIIRNNEKMGNKVFGITTADALRAQTLFATMNKLQQRGCFVPVIGGHSSKTMIPLLSQSRPASNMNFESAYDFTTKLRSYYYYPLIADSMRGWTPKLCTAYGILIFTRSILNALNGRPAKVNALVQNNDFGTSFFSGLVNVGKNGAYDMERYSNLTQFECQLLEESIQQLREDVLKGKKILELA